MFGVQAGHEDGVVVRCVFLVFLYVYADVVYVGNAWLVWGKRMWLKNVLPMLFKGVCYCKRVCDVSTVYLEVLESLPPAPPQFFNRVPKLSRVPAASSV